MNARFFLPLALGAIAWAIPVGAEQLRGHIQVHRLDVAAARGEGSGLPRLQVWAGYGLNLDFAHAGLTIQRLWLDNPNQFVLDLDGELCQEANCEGLGAGLIHLRVVTGLDFPNLTASPSGSTLLTAVAADASGRRRTYMFELVPARGVPAYAGVLLVDSSASVRAARSVEPVEPPSLAELAASDPERFGVRLLATFYRGRQTGILTATEVGQIELTLAGLRSGQSVADAAAAAGIAVTDLVAWIERVEAGTGA